MKAIKGMLLAVVMILSTAAAAQTTIGGGEYWIDGAIDARQALSSGASIDISALQPGLHTLTVRVKDSNGLWSNQVARIFFVSPPGRTDATSVTACEYWLDGVKKSEYTTLNSQVIDISDLTPGLHKVMVRVKDNLGVWNNQMIRTFFVAPKPQPQTVTLAKYMYWIDDDIANAVTGDITDDSGQLVIDMEALQLGDGDHTLTWLVGDSKGAWSEKVTVPIQTYVLGDANSDRQVNVTDIVATVNFIMNKPSTDFNFDAADVNKDSEVNVTDIVGMVNIIMKGGTQSVREAMSVLRRNGFIF